MDAKQQRWAIAESQGWRWYRLPNTRVDGERRYRCLFLPAVLETDGKLPERFSVADMTERVCNSEYMAREGMVPDYLADRNAARAPILERQHEAGFVERFNRELMVIVQRDAGMHFESLALVFYMVNASAAQLAEAFLRAAGLWVESLVTSTPTPDNERTHEG